MQEKKRHKRRLKRQVKDILFGILSAIISALVMILLAFLFTAQVSVADFTNRNVCDVYAWMESHNLSEKKVSIIYEYNDDIRNDYVIAQSMAGGETLSFFDKLVIYVSKGSQDPDGITIPDFSGWTKNAIQNWINQNGLRNHVIYRTQYDASIPEDIYISSSPGKEEILNYGDDITITISGTDFSPVYQMTDFSDYTLEYIESWAKAAGITYEVKYTRSDSVEEGTILYVFKDIGKAIPVTEIIVSSGSDGEEDFGNIVK